MTHTVKLIECGNRHQWLYVAQFTDGLVKFGCSRSPKSRLTALRNGTAKRGAYMTALHMIRPTAHMFHQEIEVKRRAVLAFGKPARGTEWFGGADFDDAMQIIDAVVAERWAAK